MSAAGVASLSGFLLQGVTSGRHCLHGVASIYGCTRLAVKLLSCFLHHGPMSRNLELDEPLALVDRLDG